MQATFYCLTREYNGRIQYAADAACRRWVADIDYAWRTFDRAAALGLAILYNVALTSSPVSILSHN